MNEDDGYTFVATLFSSTDDPNIGLAHYYLKNPDSTLYHDIYIKENDLAPDSLLDGKIFVYYFGDHCTAFQRDIGLWLLPISLIFSVLITKTVV